MKLPIIVFYRSLFPFTLTAFILPLSTQLNTISATLTQQLLRNVHYARKVIGMDCSLRIYMDQNEENLVSLKHFAVNYEPWELHKKGPKKVCTHSPEKKFRSACWHTIITISQTNETILRQKLLGNPIYDQFTFLSADGALLADVLNENQVINKVALKYGMYSEIKQDLNPKTTYLLEPKVYTGKFVQSMNFLHEKKINNLNGRSLKTPVIDVSPIFVLERYENGSVKGYRGSHYNFTMEISKRANVTVYFYETNEIGKLLENGTWTGFVGEMANGNGDFTPLMGQILIRFPLVNFTTMMYREAMLFCVKDPDPLLHWHALVFPLSRTVWAFTLTAFAGFVLLFSLIVTCKLLRMSTFKAPVLIQEGIFLPFALFLEQNIKIPTEHSARIAGLSLIWLSFVIGMVYKTNLVGYLTFPEKQSIPRTFKQLHEHKEYTVNLYSLSAIEMQILKASPSPIFQGLVKRAQITHDLEYCLISATKYKTACVTWGKVINTGIMKRMPAYPKMKKLFVTQDSAYSLDVCAAVKKNAIYFEIINRYGVYTKESGLIDKWVHDQMILERDLTKEKLMKTRDRESKQKMLDDPALKMDGEENESKGHRARKGHKALKIDNLIAVAVAFSFGCIVSICCLVFEIVIAFCLSVIKCKIK